METWIIIVTFLVIAILASAYLTNPFTKRTVVKLPYKARFEPDGLRAINRFHKLTLRQSLHWRVLAYIQCGLYILGTRYISSPASSSDSLDGIIQDIHDLRFDPRKLLLISGDQFTGLFVRNLGVFYYPMLDKSIPGSEEDWRRRQLVYLQTVAYALGVFDKTDQITTTIVSTGPWLATPVNIYAYPSDTMYGILYGIASLVGKEPARIYSYSTATDHHSLEVDKLASELLETYEQSLIRHYEGYKKYAYDSEEGLVSRNIHMSGAKDITKRTSAFYDNVIFWKTTELAMKLGLVIEDKHFLDDLKKRIVAKFWLEEDGYFLEDLSEEGVANKYYSSDWLIVLTTGFLSPENPDEIDYFIRSYDYIERMKIARPFAIKYQHNTRASRQFVVVRMAVASYGGDSIWSFWGMEYIKLCIMLYRATGDGKYLDEASFQLDAYESNILKHRGYPETYDSKGNFLQAAFYKSIRQTGWVIGFEQAREMYRAEVLKSN